MIYKELFDLDKTILKEEFLKANYPWELLIDLKSMIINIGKNLNNLKITTTGFIKFNRLNDFPYKNPPSDDIHSKNIPIPKLSITIKIKPNFIANSLFTNFLVNLISPFFLSKKLSINSLILLINTSHFLLLKS